MALKEHAMGRNSKKVAKSQNRCLVSIKVQFLCHFKVYRKNKICFGKSRSHSARISDQFFNKFTFWTIKIQETVFSFLFCKIIFQRKQICKFLKFTKVSGSFFGQVRPASDTTHFFCYDIVIIRFAGFFALFEKFAHEGRHSDNFTKQIDEQWHFFSKIPLLW